MACQGGVSAAAALRGVLGRLGGLGSAHGHSNQGMQRVHVQLGVLAGCEHAKNTWDKGGCCKWKLSPPKVLSNIVLGAGSLRVRVLSPLNSTISQLISSPLDHRNLHCGWGTL
jgi:hypothetical protein